MNSYLLIFLKGLSDKAIEHLQPIIAELKTAKTEINAIPAPTRKTIIRVFNRVVIDALKLFKEYSLQKDQELHTIWLEYFGVDL